MKWTVKHFLYQSNQWIERGNAAERGGAAYAAKQAARWVDIAKRAEATFETVNEHYRAFVA
jgi:hypothetical protein